ncbi:hypothetical protein [Heyndrickxia acidicola]|uniref:MarR family transcriptional regulator n=1 Tax=Heyndrickxia acidicola TaxID=209389 RepID=A0ABU6MFL7_9BACI|nr:hypothetical protein [Heyndrickxia acidicola]MED1203483.1 hypothetical protein [Heyndrickxia acidicola]
MDKEKLYKQVHGMIISSTKEPKYSAISTVKVADLLNEEIDVVEHTLQELVEEGRLKKSRLNDPPNYEIYLLP